jgi:hypothetical protein
MRDDLHYLDMFDAAFKDLTSDMACHDLEGCIEDHVRLGAKQPICTFDTLPQRCLNDVAFTNFRAHLNRFLNAMPAQHFPAGVQKIKLQPCDKVNFSQTALHMHHMSLTHPSDTGISVYEGQL